MSEFRFTKSTYSGGNSGQDCVEVARNVPGTVAIRDSKDPQGPILTFTPEAWRVFAARVAVRGAGA